MPKLKAGARKAKAQRAAASAGVFAAVTASSFPPACCDPAATDNFGRQTTPPDQAGWCSLDGPGYAAHAGDDLEAESAGVLPAEADVEAVVAGAPGVFKTKQLGYERAKRAAQRPGPWGKHPAGQKRQRGCEGKYVSISKYSKPTVGAGDLGVGSPGSGSDTGGCESDGCAVESGGCAVAGTRGSADFTDASTAENVLQPLETRGGGVHAPAATQRPP